MELTKILNHEELEPTASAEEILPVVYEELRRLAVRRMSGEAAGHTLQPTALVHEVWLRLMGQKRAGWRDRHHFFAAASEAMRRILVDHARKKSSQKRGGGVDLEELDESSLCLAAPPEELLAVHTALDRLAEEDAEAAELVKLRYFMGLSMEDAATALGQPVRSTERLWSYAKAWLRREIRRETGSLASLEK